MIEILDTTLRDGGYQNDWNFGEKNIKSVIKNLLLANVDYIELGFLSNKKTNKDKTVFNSLGDANEFIEKYDYQNFNLMIKADDFDIEKLKKNNTKIKKIRYIFKKQKSALALYECEKLIDFGYELFINPVFIDDYEKNEYYKLIEKINALKPYTITIVDSMGSILKEDIEKIFLKTNDIIDDKINLALHCHNGAKDAFENAKALFKLNLKRNIIIDCAIFGMGRGAGNLKSERIASYLNQNYKNNYKIEFLEKIKNDTIRAFFQKNPWGYNKIYEICALNHCHSNYARFLINENKNLSSALINDIFASIPKDKKTNYDEKFLKELIEKSSQVQLPL